VPITSGRNNTCSQSKPHEETRESPFEIVNTSRKKC
jgi:hypothetical protein